MTINAVSETSQTGSRQLIVFEICEQLVSVLHFHRPTSRHFSVKSLDCRKSLQEKSWRSNYRLQKSPSWSRRKLREHFLFLEIHVQYRTVKRTEYVQNGLLRADFENCSGWNQKLSEIWTVSIPGMNQMNVSVWMRSEDFNRDAVSIWSPRWNASE